MNRRDLVRASVRLPLTVALLAAAPARGEDVPRAGEPVLRLDGSGPMSFVSALAFAQDGKALYQAGWDKVVRVWDRDPRTGRLAPAGRAVYRTPIGPGVAGALNALAVSPDGAWIAVAGNEVAPGMAGFRDDGLIVPRPGMTEEMRLAQGTIYAFDTRQSPPRCRVLRGHRGEVYALAFSPPAAGAPSRLVSAGGEPRDAGPGAKEAVLTLRVWDVATGAYLGGTQGPAVSTFRPQLAVWAAVPGGRGLRVAAAWGADSFLTWDADGRAPARAFGAAPGAGARFVHTALAYDAVGGRLLTGHFPVNTSAGASPLRSWDTAALAAGATASGAALAWDGPELDMAGALCLPLSMAVASSVPGGPRDLLVVVVRGVRKGQKPGEPFMHRLQLIDLGLAGPGRRRVGGPLWEGTIQPFVTASADGSSLAVAGNAADQVRVYSVTDLLAGRDTSQVLQGDGNPVRYATFARRGNDVGLFVGSSAVSAPGGPPPAPKVGDVVFDATNRRVVPYTPDWTLPPQPAGWRAVVDQDDIVRVRVEREGQVVGRVSLKPMNPANPPARVGLTEFALSPASAAGRPPLLAVATDEPGVGPSLRLFNGATGEFLRQLTGHAGPVRGLAFSSDGRLLGSASDDRTVCVWSLTDLGDPGDGPGGIPGLVLKDGGGSCVVDRVEDGGPFALRPGDVVRGVLRDGREVPFASAIEFYRGLAARKPGEPVTLRLVRGRRTEDVAVTLGRAADERKPLLSLFLARPDADASRGWLVWTPSGPFDSNGGDVENIFGWHFDTGRPDEPARFSRLAEGENRKLFRFEGLAVQALDLGRVPARPAPAPRKLGLELEIDPPPFRESPDGLVIRQPPQSLHVTLKDAADRAGEVSSVVWRADDGPEKAMPSDAAGSWTADLGGLNLTRGRHRLTVSVRARGADAQVERGLTVVYVPPPPAVTLLQPDPGASSRLVVTRPEFRLRARIEPAAGEPARFAVDCRNGNEAVYERGADADPIDRPYELDERLVLKPGPNVIALTARNDHAEAAFEDLETRRLPLLVVTYTPEPVRPPTIRLEPIAGSPNEPSAGPAVSVPRVSLAGQIEAEEPLAEAQWRSDPSGAWERFRDFQPVKSRTLNFRNEVTLAPGRNTLRVRARAGERAWREEVSEIEYRPPAPRVVAIETDPPGRVVVHPQPARIRLTARLEGRPEGYPRSDALCSLFVNGERQAAAPVLDRAARTLVADVALKDRENAVAVVIRNEWKEESKEVIEVTYRRPPRVLDLRAIEPDGSPFTDVLARVDSLLPLLGAEVEVRNHETGDHVARREAVRSKEDGSWLVTSKAVPLSRGENQILVHVWNADGDDRGPERGRNVAYREKTVPPTIVYAEPAPDSRQTRPGITVRFRVRSVSPLTGIALLRERAGESDEVLREFDVGGAKQEARGEYEYQGETEVTLVRSVNALKLVATNGGGEAVERRNVTYVPPPVAVAIDRVDSAEAPGSPRLPRLSAVGEVTFDRPAADGRATLHGRLVWADEAARREGKDTRAQVWVNGFPQVSPALSPRPGHPLESEFHAEILLSQPANAVEVRLIGAAAGDGVLPRFTLRCEKTYRDQMMHLLIVGVGVRDEEALKQRAVRGLGGRLVAGSPDRFETPAFPLGRVYPPVCRDVSTAKVYGSLRRIRKNLPMGGRASSDVVVVYYHGAESFEAGDPVLRLRAGTERGDQDVLPLSEIIRYFEGTRGAKLFLFDVTRPAGPPATQEEDRRWSQVGTEYGFLRFIWRDQPDLTRTDAPADASLTTALADAVRRSATLREVDREVAREARQLQLAHPNLFYTSLISAPMTDLILGPVEGSAPR
jgi:WD40 repeat protein